MAGSAVTRNVVQFGLFELDLQARELRKSGIRIKLQDQPFEILAMLLERPGEIVAREDLQKRLWPEDTFVDFDLSLNSAVKKLRQALNDDSDNPRFVETLYRRGYRFIGPVNGIAKASESHLPDATVEPALPDPVLVRTAASVSSVTPRSKGLLLFSGVLAALVAVAVLSFTPRPTARVLGYTQITHDGQPKAGMGLMGEILTDGERLYLSELDGDRFVIAQVSARGGETAILPTPFTNVAPSDIASDGSALLITSFKSAGSSSTWNLPLPAGSPRRISDLPSMAAWSQDGRELAFARESEIYLAKSDGTEPHKLVTAKGRVGNVRFSPDDKRLRFDVYDARTASSEIWEVNHDGTGLHSLLSGWSCCGNWIRDGKYFVFQRFGEGMNNIWALPDRASWLGGHAAPVQLTNGPLDFSAPTPSRDGKKLFVIGSHLRDELLRFDPNTKSGSAPYLANLSATDLAFSSDGQWIAYVSIPEHILWRSRLDGSQPLQLTSSSIHAALPRWSPDGKQLVFMGRANNTNYRAYLISANAGDLRELIPGTDIGFDPGWSPDGKLIVLTLSESESPEKPGIWIWDLASEKMSELPESENFFSPRWSPDGKYIAAITRDLQKLMLFDVSAQRWAELGNAPSGPIGYPSWSHDGEYLYFDTTFNEDPAFYRIRASDRKVEKLLNLKEMRRFLGEFGSWTGLAPDDSLLTVHDLSSQEIYALDWQAP